MFIQIEISTLCNFRCFYCTSLKTKGRLMSVAQFDSLLRRLPRGRHVVSLQGEGEPLARRRFFTLVESVWRAGHVPYVITNCSLAKSIKLPIAFPRIGISLDTVDPAEAEQIGRLRLDLVLANLEQIVAAAGPDRIAVHSVDLGQDMKPLKQYLGRLGIERHIVQPVQTKEDYRRHYPDRLAVPVSPQQPAPCRYLAKPSMRFFNIDGIEMPCAYIKDASRFQSEESLKKEFAMGRAPTACTGCREIGNFSA